MDSAAALWVCIASAVTMRPFSASISSSFGIAAISFDLSATFTWPSTRRARAAKACTRCTGERAAASAKDRRRETCRQSR